MDETKPRGISTTDPDRIRALAHPVRLDLIELIDELGEATATQCAERLGETVANCSFHLRVLAKAGFIEPAPARGREKPWRPAAEGGRRMSIEPGNPASRLAVAEVASLSMVREVERVRSFIQQQPDPPPGWEDTVTVTTHGFWATADELREVVDQLATLTDRFAGRSKDPSLRPEGARHARLLATVNPDSFPDADEASADAPPAAPTTHTSPDTEVTP